MTDKYYAFALMPKRDVGYMIVAGWSFYGPDAKEQAGRHADINRESAIRLAEDELRDRVLDPWEIRSRASGRAAYWRVEKG